MMVVLLQGTGDGLCLGSTLGVDHIRPTEFPSPVNQRSIPFFGFHAINPLNCLDFKGHWSLHAFHFSDSSRRSWLAKERGACPIARRLLCVLCLQLLMPSNTPAGFSHRPIVSKPASQPCSTSPLQKVQSREKPKPVFLKATEFAVTSLIH